MLVSHVDKTEKYQFTVYPGDRLFILLVTQEILARGGNLQPLWYREVGNEESLTAMLRWVSLRRPQWQIWGKLAEEIGLEAFAVHMEKLWNDEPLVQCVATTVTADQDDPTAIVLGEMVQGASGHGVEQLYRHRFASAEDRTRFYRWFNTGKNHELATSLMTIGYNEGTLALGVALEDIVAKDRAKSQPRGRRRGKKLRWPPERFIARPDGRAMNHTAHSLSNTPQQRQVIDGRERKFHCRQAWEITMTRIRQDPSWSGKAAHAISGGLGWSASSAGREARAMASAIQRIGGRLDDNEPRAFVRRYFGIEAISAQPATKDVRAL